MTASSFAVTLADLLSGESIADVANALEVSERTVRSWLRGERVTTPDRVFALEMVLEVAPGTLSHHLGYVPADAAATGVVLDETRRVAAEDVVEYRVAATAPLAALLERVDPERAARRGLQLELMRVVVEDFEAEHRPLTEQELATARRELGVGADRAST